MAVYTDNELVFFKKKAWVLHITGGLRDFHSFLLGYSYDIYFLMLGNTRFYLFILLNLSSELDFFVCVEVS